MCKNRNTFWSHLKLAKLVLLFYFMFCFGCSSQKLEKSDEIKQVFVFSDSLLLIQLNPKNKIFSCYKFQGGFIDVKNRMVWKLNDSSQRLSVLWSNTSETYPEIFIRDLERCKGVYHPSQMNDFKVIIHTKGIGSENITDKYLNRITIEEQNRVSDTLIIEASEFILPSNSLGRGAGFPVNLFAIGNKIFAICTVKYRESLGDGAFIEKYDFIPLILSE